MILFAICLAVALLSFVATALYTFAYLARAIVRLVRALLPMLFIVGLCAGCAHPIDTAIVSINAAQVTLSTTEEIVAKQERAQRDNAIAFAHDATDAKAKVEAVYTDYRPIWASYHDAWMRWSALRNLVASLKMRDASGQVVDLSQALKGIDDLAAMLTALSMTIETDIKRKP